MDGAATLFVEIPNAGRVGAANDRIATGEVVLVDGETTMGEKVKAEAAAADRTAAQAAV